MRGQLEALTAERQGVLGGLAAGVVEQQLEQAVAAAEQADASLRQALLDAQTALATAQQRAAQGAEGRDGARGRARPGRGASGRRASAGRHRPGRARSPVGARRDVDHCRAGGRDGTAGRRGPLAIGARRATRAARAPRGERARAGSRGCRAGARAGDRDAGGARPDPGADDGDPAGRRHPPRAVFRAGGRHCGAGRAHRAVGKHERPDRVGGRQQVPDLRPEPDPGRLARPREPPPGGPGPALPAGALARQRPGPAGGRRRHGGRGPQRLQPVGWRASWSPSRWPSASPRSPSHRTRVESLFIDEGFGSLDPETLDTAIASLDALQALGRRSG